MYCRRVAIIRPRLHTSHTSLPKNLKYGLFTVPYLPTPQKLGYKEEALSKYMCAGQVLGAVADVN